MAGGRFITQKLLHFCKTPFHPAKPEFYSQIMVTLSSHPPFSFLKREPIFEIIFKSRSEITMNPDVTAYNNSQSPTDEAICELLAVTIDKALPKAENKIWHRHPVWFLDGNPIVGYSKLKDSVRLLFWSGQSFDEPGLAVEGSFKAAEKRYTDISEVKVTELKRWLKKSKEIQWDYKNIVKRKGKLERLM